MLYVVDVDVHTVVTCMQRDRTKCMNLQARTSFSWISACDELILSAILGGGLTHQRVLLVETHVYAISHNVATFGMHQIANSGQGPNLDLTLHRYVKPT